MKAILAFTLCMVCLGLWPAKEAEAKVRKCKLPDEYVVERPGDHSVPTPVSVGVYVINIELIDNAKQNFTSDFVIKARWKDKRLAWAKTEQTGDRRCRYQLSAVWNPRIQIFNQRRIFEWLDREVLVDWEGNVEYVQRYYGTISNALDLKDFPLDVQKLEINVVPFGFSNDQVELRFDLASSGFNRNFSLAGWTIDSSRAELDQIDLATNYSFRIQRISNFKYEFDAVREMGYYIWKVIVPLTVIVMMSWAVFWIEPLHIGPQISVATTSILAMITFFFSLSNILPPISYLTRIDFYIYSSLSLLFLALAQAVLTCSLAYGSHKQIARKLDVHARWVFPLIYVGILYMFWAVDRPY